VVYGAVGDHEREKMRAKLGLLCRRVVFFTVIAILLFDLYLYAFGGHESTITDQLQWATYVRHGTLIFCFGYIAGHIFGKVDS
jgi:hypothetical protein